jgi:hypothetical protein
MMHCHMMNHKEMGMMQAIEVYKDGGLFITVTEPGSLRYSSVCATREWPLWRSQAQARRDGKLAGVVGFP